MDKINLTIVPFHDYKKWINEGFRTRDAHLFEHFSFCDRVNKILVINRPMSLAEALFKRKKWYVDGENVEYRKNGIQLTKINDKVWCLDFFVYDFFKVIIQRKDWWFSAFNYSKITNAINEAQMYLNMDSTVLFLENPMSIGVIDKVNHKKLVFDAIDNWLYHPQMKNKKLIKNNYDYIEKNADIIFTVSESLCNLFSKNKNTFWISNGVDIEFFNKAINADNVKENIYIGYVGKIQDRVDFELVEKCLIKYKDVNFEFAGPILSQKNVINKINNRYSNVSFIGDVHYSKLPEVMKKYDICIIPHKVDKFTNSMNPLKLYEYMAAGKIIVTSKIAGIIETNKYIYSCENDDEFLDKLGAAINVAKENKANPQMIASSIPDEFLWKNISSKMIDIIIGEKDE